MIDTVSAAQAQPDTPLPFAELGLKADEYDRIALRYVDDVNGARGRVAGVLSEGRNVMGLMPHPEHAVDLLTGSADGLKVLAAA